MLARESHAGSRQGSDIFQNEDFILCDDILGIYAVADGMGGGPAGDEASKRAAVTFLQWMDGCHVTSDIKQCMDVAFSAANCAVLRIGESDSMNTGAGTTLTALVFRCGTFYIAHVGDSRVYRYRNGQLLQMTTDHTVGEELASRDHIRRCAIKDHPLGNILTRVIGDEKGIEPEFVTGPVQANDVFILATDGFIDAISPEDLPAIIQSTLEAGVDVLVEALIERAGKKARDDYSVAAVRLLNGGIQTNGRRGALPYQGERYL